MSNCINADVELSVVEYMAYLEAGDAGLPVGWGWGLTS